MITLQKPVSLESWLSSLHAAMTVQGERYPREMRMDLRRERRDGGLRGSQEPALSSAASLHRLWAWSPALLVALAIGWPVEDPRAQSRCKTGAVDVTAISEAEYDAAAAEAGVSACVTVRSGMTVCQMPPLTTDVWTVVAQAPAGAGDAQSAVELSVYHGLTCLFDAGTPVENTDSRWIQATTSYEIGENPPAINFIATVQIGTTSLLSTVCPFGDGADGRSCQVWTGR
jgi:hypothetical protein